MAVLKIKSIKDLVSEKDFFLDKNVTPDSIIGLGIGYLMEEAKIPDFTYKNYDYNSIKTLRDYDKELVQAMKEGKLLRFFEKITTVEQLKKYSASMEQAILNKYRYVFKNFDPVLKNNLDTIPAQLYDAFRNIILYEPNKERKTELQLMELVMLSRLSSQNKKNLENRFRNINGNNVPDRLMPIYDKASFYFL